MTDDEIKKWAAYVAEMAKNDPEPIEEEVGDDEIIDETAENLVIFLKKRK